jgi:predicted CoA-binding protein
MIITTDMGRASLLAQSPRVAILGASSNPNRASFFVFSYLRGRGLDVVPVNPAYDQIAGVVCVPTLADVSPRPDIVDVFRRPTELPGIVEEVIAIGAPVLWLQYGVIHEGAIRRADEAGLQVVVDRCLKVEWARLCGGLAAAGMNTGRISSRVAS